jgi:hypothetical protein
MFYACLGPFVIFVQCQIYALLQSILKYCNYLCEDVLVDARVIADKVTIPIKPVSYTDQTGVSIGSQDGQIGCENRSDRYCVTSYPFSFSCVLSLAICITYTCMTLSHLLAPHKLRDIGGIL